MKKLFLIVDLSISKEKMLYIAYLSVSLMLIAMTSMSSGDSSFSYRVNKFNDIVVTLSKREQNFEESLLLALKKWKKEGYNGVWLTIPLEYAEYVSIALKLKFAYHYATPEKIVMTYWLPDSESTLPPHATHTVGIAACVIDDEQNILVVQERYNPSWGYRMPSGGVKIGESIKDAAIRETKEETGIDTEFIEILGLWERHKGRTELTSDFYFLCRLRPLTKYISVQDTQEITDARWVPYDTFKKQAGDILTSFVKIQELSPFGFKPYSLPDPFKPSTVTTLYACPGLTQ